MDKILKLTLNLKNQNFSNIYNKNLLKSYFLKKIIPKISSKDHHQFSCILKIHKKTFSNNLKNNSKTLENGYKYENSPVDITKLEYYQNLKSNEPINNGNDVNNNCDKIKEKVQQNFQFKLNENFDNSLKDSEKLKTSTASLPLEEKFYMKIVHKFIEIAKNKTLLLDSEKDELPDNKYKHLLEEGESFNFPKNLKPLKSIFGEENFKYFIFILENPKNFEINFLNDFLKSIEYYNLSTYDILNLNSLIFDLFLKEHESYIAIALIIVDYLGYKKNRKIFNSEIFKRSIDFIKKQDTLTLENIGSLQIFANFLSSLSNYQVLDRNLNKMLVEFYQKNSESFNDNVILYLHFKSSILKNFLYFIKI